MKIELGMEDVRSEFKQNRGRGGGSVVRADISNVCLRHLTDRAQAVVRAFGQPVKLIEDGIYNPREFVVSHDS